MRNALVGMMDTIVTKKYYCDVSKWRKTNARRGGCYCDVSRWRGFETDRQPLFSISRACNMHRPPTNTEYPTTQLGSVGIVDAIIQFYLSSAILTKYTSAGMQGMPVEINTKNERFAIVCLCCCQNRK